jgi:hypothetical protein
LLSFQESSISRNNQRSRHDLRRFRRGRGRFGNFEGEEVVKKMSMFAFQLGSTFFDRVVRESEGGGIVVELFERELGVDLSSELSWIGVERHPFFQGI